jgi:hypothetical protein
MTMTGSDGPARRYTATDCVKDLAECPRDPGGHGHLEDYLIDRCVAFKGNEYEAVVLLRQILDEVVRFANGTRFIIILIRQALKPYPEDEGTKTDRRDFFEAYGHWPPRADG